jgi:hypothetical protein
MKKFAEILMKLREIAGIFFPIFTLVAVLIMGSFLILNMEVFGLKEGSLYIADIISLHYAHLLVWAGPSHLETVSAKTD